MKILITGKNRSGKTTLLTDLLADMSPKQGFLTVEVRQNSDRIGFDLVNENGRTIPLARTEMATDFTVGRYFVDVAALDKYLESYKDIRPNHLLYIDEIGQMQLYSTQFKQIVLQYINSDNHFIGTITCVYKDAFVEEINNRPDILRCKITPENRREMREGLASALEYRDLIDGLAPRVQRALIDMATTYLEADEYVYFKKLFKNAVPYIAQDRIHPQEGGSYLVSGDTNEHQVVPTEAGDLACDCDLFHGRGQFVGQQGLCSHIQTATLFILAETTVFEQ
jgi:nucleoside-triphosphatase THEP1